MRPLQSNKIFLAIAPATQDNADFVSYVIDTAELNDLEFIGLLGSIDAAMPS